MDEIVLKIRQQLNNTTDEHPLKIAFNKQLEYYSKFECIVTHLGSVMNNQQINDLLQSKLLLGLSFNLAQYLQGACELSILNCIFEKYQDSFIYEPTYNGKRNVECSFRHKGKTINVEVKTPDLSKHWEYQNRNTLKFVTPERIPDNKLDKFQAVSVEIMDSYSDKIEGKYDGVETLPRQDNKLMDFLKSAQSKFPHSNEENFNILVVVLYNTEDLDEWYNYLFAEKGVFTDKSFLHDETPKRKMVAYDKVDAIVLTNMMYGHVHYGQLTDIWKMSNWNSFVFLNPDDRQHSEKGFFYFNEMLDFLNAQTEDFFDFLQRLDKKVKEDSKQINNKQQLIYTMHKIIDLQIFTEYEKDLNERHEKQT